jgi:hypothetical protein
LGRCRWPGEIEDDDDNENDDENDGNNNDDENDGNNNDDGLVECEDGSLVTRHIGKGFFLSKIIFSILLLSLSVHIYSNHKIPFCSPLLRQLKT